MHDISVLQINEAGLLPPHKLARSHVVINEYRKLEVIVLWCPPIRNAPKAGRGRAGLKLPNQD